VAREEPRSSSHDLARDSCRAKEYITGTIFFWYMKRRTFLTSGSLLLTPIAAGISGKSNESSGTEQDSESKEECPPGSSKNVQEDGSVTCFSHGLPAESRETESESEKDIERAAPPGMVRRLRESERERPASPWWRR